SVPHTPSAKVRARMQPSDAGGGGMSSSRAELATPGSTVIARMNLVPKWRSRLANGAVPYGMTRDGTSWFPDAAFARGKPDGTYARFARSLRVSPQIFSYLEVAAMEALGRTRWAIAEGYIPSESSSSDRTLISHETACILNSTDRDAHVAITIFFADRE